MEDIIVLYFIAVVCILCIVFFAYTKNVKEGLSLSTEDVENNLTGNNDSSDPCEYNLEVKGLLPPVELILFETNILEPVNDIVNIINEIIIYVDFFIHKFIGCLLFYILDAIGLLFWAIIYGILKCINMHSILDEIYEYIDKNIDENLYYYTGMHIIHFPTLYQNRCYHIDGKDRTECWRSPYGNNSNKNKEGINSIINNTEQNMDFYQLLFILLIVLAILLVLSILFFWIKSFFPPTIICGDGNSCES